jgi:hypothetical protein
MVYHYYLTDYEDGTSTARTQYEESTSQTKEIVTEQPCHHSPDSPTYLSQFANEHRRQQGRATHLFTHWLHTVIKPRGAFVRDAKKWSDHLDGTIKFLAKRIRYVKGIGGQLGVSRIFRSTTRTKGTFMDICPAESIAQ